MLKHVALYHKECRPEDIKFKMQIVSQHQTAFERQITEAVLIRKNTGATLMNSKKEYNRCYIPQIVVKEREEDDKKDASIEAENSALEIIRKMQSLWKKRSREGDKTKSDENAPKNERKRCKLDDFNPEKDAFLKGGVLNCDIFRKSRQRWGA